MTQYCECHHRVSWHENGGCTEYEVVINEEKQKAEAVRYGRIEVANPH